jgi:hypothetical protein
MKLIQLFNVLLVFSSVFAGSIKPTNVEDLEIIKISSDQNDTNTYYKISNNNEIVFENLDRILNKDKNYIIKIISRTSISKNSNSNKTFGFNLKIEDGDEKIFTDQLKYKKKVSLSKSPNKNGFHFTNAGFWLEEITFPEALEIKIASLKGSPDVYIRITYREVVDREDAVSLYPISQIPYNTLYLSSTVEPPESHKKSTKWYEIISDNKKVQYKIIGPKLIKVRTRIVADSTKGNYNLIIYEDGYLKSTHLYKFKSPRNEVYILDENNEKIQLSRQEFNYINIPEGTHYYSFRNSVKSSNMYVKIESYDK